MTSNVCTPVTRWIKRYNSSDDCNSIFSHVKLIGDDLVIVGKDSCAINQVRVARINALVGSIVYDIKFGVDSKSVVNPTGMVLDS